jgi:hypothetical protein
VSLSRGQSLWPCGLFPGTRLPSPPASSPFLAL